MKHNHPVVVAFYATKDAEKAGKSSSSPVPAHPVHPHTQHINNPDLMPKNKIVSIKPVQPGYAYNPPLNITSPVPHFAKLPENQYEYFSPTRPVWIEDESVLDILETSFNVTEYSPKMGHFVTGNGGIINARSGSAPGVISAMALDYDANNDKMRAAPAYIVNTENFGLCYTGITKDGVMVDLGPVINTCIVGNVVKPEGIYIPLGNTKAMADGLHIIQREMDRRIESGKGMKSCFELSETENKLDF